MVKNVLRRCVICKKFQGRTYLPPSSPDLPEFRLNLFNAFQATGLDYAGPLFVKDFNCKDGRKVYILLFTCAGSRAIHLELCANMTNDSFIQGFRRFSSRGGVPNLVVHDNFKTFRSKDVKRFFAKTGVSQKFILPASPWWGEFYERLVRTVKTSLKKTLGKSFISFEQLRTLLCEIESVINSRPLHYVSDDDNMKSLTPNHLIFGRDISKQSSVLEKVPEFTIEDCKERVRNIDLLQKTFWKQFSSIYLSELRQSNIYRKNRTVDEPQVAVGDIVLISGEVLPRAEWKMGRIEKLIMGRDGKIRGAMLRTTSKSGKGTIIHRPLQKMIPLEVNTMVTPENTRDTARHSSTDDTVDESQCSSSKRTRKAAIEGQYLRRLKEGRY